MYISVYYTEQYEETYICILPVRRLLGHPYRSMPPIHTITRVYIGLYTKRNICGYEHTLVSIALLVILLECIYKQIVKNKQH